ncbi:uncharacterized protein FPRO_11480 [Fusarium proliferatum ET1]|uniref:Uncharacterized protein n=1 Tax=Fusarium proliferatum (strain ET1) TaxID=1227346 RepID=A0A1L7W048_FUSPR|nr:uncharacterized protein FPRO_11480 [Fusarium proliferatum ET1]CZR46033.1 uncharacterized protein FPRO_11480 [Fusarium proliferatum ET1]
MANKAAAVPGSGEDKVVSTDSFDVTRFVDSLLNTDEEWLKQSVIIGEKITTNEINAITKDVNDSQWSMTMYKSEASKGNRI